MEQSDYQNYHITQDELNIMQQEVMSYIDSLAINAVFKKYPYLKSFKTLTDPFEKLAHIDILNGKIADTKVKHKLTIDKIWTMPVRNWSLTISQLAIFFEGRIDKYLEM